MKPMPYVLTKTYRYIDGTHQPFSWSTLRQLKTHPDFYTLDYSEALPQFSFAKNYSTDDYSGSSNYHLLLSSCPFGLELPNVPCHRFNYSRQISRTYSTSRLNLPSIVVVETKLGSVRKMENPSPSGLILLPDRSLYSWGSNLLTGHLLNHCQVLWCVWRYGLLCFYCQESTIHYFICPHFHGSI